jgi:hypothetical protein
MERTTEPSSTGYPWRGVRDFRMKSTRKVLAIWMVIRKARTQDHERGAEGERKI